MATTEPSVSPARDERWRAAAAKAEQLAPGYVDRVRLAAARLAAGPDRRGDLRASLATVEEAARVDLDAPTLSRLAAGRGLKEAVKRLTRWYLRYVGDQVTAFGQAVATFGREVADRTDELADQQAATAAKLAALEARVGQLEKELKRS